MLGIFGRVINRFHHSLVDIHVSANRGRYALFLGGVSIGKFLKNVENQLLLSVSKAVSYSWDGFDRYH